MLFPGNLSLDQAPPISVPFRFLLSAPLFGVLAGLLLALQGPALLAGRWTPGVLAFTHLITLGLVTQAMCGALLQMLPVLAGTRVLGAVAVGRVTHLLLGGGTLALAIGFLADGGPWSLAAAALLGSAFLVFVTALGCGLARAGSANPTVVAMRLAVIALAVTATLGVGLALFWGGIPGLLFLRSLTDVHLAWGLLGWVGLLVLGVAYQALPMFQLTPEYPLRLRRHLTTVLFALLLLWSVLYRLAAAERIPSALPVSAAATAGAALLLFAAFTVRLQKRRRRPLPDAGLAWWRLGLAGLAIAVTLWLAGRVWPGFAAHPAYPLWLGGSYLLGFAVPILNGMMIKIVPFLAWFHLQNRQLALGRVEVSVPNLRELLPERTTRWQLRIYVAGLGLLALAPLWPALASRPAGLALAASWGLLGFGLGRAARRYRRVNRQLLAPAAGEIPAA